MIDLDGLNLRDFFEAARAESPNAPYLIYAEDDTSVSYDEFGTLVERSAAVWHDLGVRHGDRVAFMMDNVPLFMWAWFGLAQLGGVLVAINTGFLASEAEYLVRDSGARFALVSDGYRNVMEDVRRELPELTVLSAGDHPDRRFSDLMEQDLAEAPSTALRGDDIISLIYTSGTTGNPKGVMQTHRNFVLTGQAYVDWMQMRQGDRIYACLPLFHINSQAYSAMAAIEARGAFVLSRRFSATKFWPEVRRHHVTVFNFIGAMAMILTKSDPSPDDADNDVRIAYGVPALAVEVVAEIENRFGLTCISGFGMSETTFGLLEPLDQPRRPGSMGVERQHPDPSVPRTRAKIVDPKGNEVPRGTPGELILTNAAIMLGYFGMPEKTADTLVDGWLHTGDGAYQDDDGYFFFVDRLKDIVRRRGENVSSLEVERAIARHPAVAEAAVIGVPADLSDEELMAFVVPREGRSDIAAADVFDWASQVLAAFKVPQYVRFVDSLPKTPTAKVQKEKLRAADLKNPGLRISREPVRK